MKDVRDPTDLTIHDVQPIGDEKNYRTTYRRLLHTQSHFWYLDGNFYEASSRYQGDFLLKREVWAGGAPALPFPAFASLTHTRYQLNGFKKSTPPKNHQLIVYYC